MLFMKHKVFFLIKSCYVNMIFVGWWGKFFFDTKLLVFFFFFLLDLQSFITQDPRDRDFLVKNLKSFDVPVLNYTGDEGRAPLPFQLTKEVCDLGPNYVLQLNGPTILSSICFLFFWKSNHLISHFFFFDTKQMHSIGIYSWLDQVFNAPNAV